MMEEEEEEDARQLLESCSRVMLKSQQRLTAYIWPSYNQRPQHSHLSDAEKLECTTLHKCRLLFATIAGSLSLLLSIRHFVSAAGSRLARLRSNYCPALSTVGSSPFLATIIVSSQRRSNVDPNHRYRRTLWLGLRSSQGSPCFTCSGFRMQSHPDGS